MQSKKEITKPLVAAGDEDDLEDGYDMVAKDFERIEHECNIIIPAILEMNSADIILRRGPKKDNDLMPFNQAKVLVIGDNSIGNCLLPPN